MNIKELEHKAENGCDKAINTLALAYFNGDGIGKNYIQAVALWELSANNGNMQAMFNLANCCKRGHGMPKASLIKALYWYKMAADKGNVDAMVSLGDMYANGRCVSQSYPTAVYWYTQALCKGHKSVIACIGSLGVEV